MPLFEKQKSNVEIIKTAITAICEEDKIKKTTKTPRAYQLEEISARILEKVGNCLPAFFGHHSHFDFGLGVK